jgi:transposase
MNASMIGLDIAKSVFQVHGESADGKIVLQRRLRRAQVEAFFAKLPPARIGIEACGSAHYWGRTLRALGHDVGLIPAAYVKPFVKRNKNDARDAAAICAALGRPDMRFVPIKSVEQQGMRALERSRDLLVKQRVQLMNSVRGQLAELGLAAAQGSRGFAELTACLAAADARIPAPMLAALRALVGHAQDLLPAIAAMEKQILAAARDNEAMRRLAEIPGVGGLTAHAIVAAIGAGGQFGSARDFAAWVGLTPRESSSANKRRLGGLSRQGDNRLRKLLALGASTIMRNARSRQERATDWQRGLIARRPMKVAVLAQAAKTARIAWALLASGESYRPRRDGAEAATKTLAPASASLAPAR